MERKDPLESKELVKFSSSVFINIPLVISPDGKRLAYYVPGSKKIIIVNLKDNSSLSIIRKDEVRNLAWVNNDNLVFSEANGKLVKYDLKAWINKEATFLTDVDGIGHPLDLMPIPGSNKFITLHAPPDITDDQNLVRWNLKTLQGEVFRLNDSTDHSYLPSVITILNDSEFALLTSNQYIRILDNEFKDKKETGIRLKHGSIATSLAAVSPDRVVVRCNRDDYNNEDKDVIQLWDIRTEKLVKELEILGLDPDSNLTVLRFPDCYHFALAYTHPHRDALAVRTLQQFDTQTGESLGHQTLPSLCKTIIVNPSNSRLITVNKDRITEEKMNWFPTFQEGHHAILPFIQHATGPLHLILEYLGLFRTTPPEGKEGSPKEKTGQKPPEGPKGGS